ncbi:MAG: hypothetical protein ABFC88_04710 [Thermoguttaceae bacterium]
MVELDNLRVSLTKNGYLKVAEIVAAYPSDTMLDHCSGDIHGVNLVRSQVANILCADTTGMVPAFWDEVRQHDRPTIRAFVLVAIIFAHKRLIAAIQEAGQGSPTGTLFRDDMNEKEYTNLQFAMATIGLCAYARGTDQINYDMTALTSQLRPAGILVGDLLRAKLRRCGWRDPDEFRVAPDLPLDEQCVQEGFHKVFGLTAEDFRKWIDWRPQQPR